MLEKLAQSENGDVKSLKQSKYDEIALKSQQSHYGSKLLSHQSNNDQKQRMDSSPEKNYGAITKSPSRSPSRASTDREEKMDSDDDDNQSDQQLSSKMSENSSNTSVKNVEEIEDHLKSSYQASAQKYDDEYQAQEPNQEISLIKTTTVGMHQTANAFLDSAKSISIKSIQQSKKLESELSVEEIEYEPVELLTHYQLDQMDDEDRQMYV